MKLLLLTFLLALTQLPAYAQDDYCFGKDTDRPQTRHFTTKTAYQIIKGTNIERQYLVPGCTPTKMWILHRHGTRLPEKSIIEKAPRLEQLRDEIVKNYGDSRTKPSTNALCQEDRIALKMWKWNTSITPDMDQYLTVQGYEDLKGTAKLYQKYYPNVLPKQYSRDYYKFRHTDTQRTLESFKGFSEGLFGPNNDAQADPIPDKDLLLRPYDYCKSWEEHDYSSAESERGKYRHSSTWNDTIADISARLGFPYTLDDSDVQLMFNMCRYEQAWQVDRTSVWCAAFLPEQVSIFEYEDDLKYYYKLGYGYDENTRLNCRSVQDMLTHLNSKDNPAVVAYFAHSAGLQTFLSSLGIAKDDIPLRANNQNQHADRRWRTSYLDPFAANFVAVKYECPNESEKEKVVFFLNQNAVELDWCHVGLCNWSDVMKQYETIYKADCSEYYCRSGAASMIVSLTTLLVAVIGYLI